MLLLLSALFKKRKEVPSEYMRMVLTEYRSVKPEFVEYFYNQNKRLPTMEELHDAI